jgi:hypothetical protein
MNPNKVPAMRLTAEQKLERYKVKLAAAHKKRHQALALRESGMTVQEVGDAMGITKQRASQMIIEATAEREQG